MLRRLCTFILKVTGWTRIGNVAEEDKCIILAAPHTSYLDFLLGCIYYVSLGGSFTVMIKKEAFFWPLGPILRKMGAIPIDRANSQSMIISLIHELRQPGKCHLVMCPEGTRKAVRRWKTGYHTIARQAGIPVYLALFDYKTKHIGLFEKIELTDDARGDTDRIQLEYEKRNLTARHPEGYVTR